MSTISGTISDSALSDHISSSSFSHHQTDSIPHPSTPAMAPITLNTVDSKHLLRSQTILTKPGDLKEVIQHLFEIQSAVHGYLGPETQQELVRKMYVRLFDSVLRPRRRLIRNIEKT